MRYDGATGPSGGPTPGAIAVRNHWTAVTGLGNQGIYNPRKVRGSTTTWSVHATGRAVDLKANAHDPWEKATADAYAAFLIRHAVTLQVQYLIWNRRSWSLARGWRTYSGVSPHEDHIHVELNLDGGRDVTLSKLDALWARDHEKEDDDVNKALAITKIEYLYRLVGRNPHGDPAGLAYWCDRVADAPVDDVDGVVDECGALLYYDATK